MFAIYTAVLGLIVDRAVGGVGGRCTGGGPAPRRGRPASAQPAAGAVRSLRGGSRVGACRCLSSGDGCRLCRAGLGDLQGPERRASRSPSPSTTTTTATRAVATLRALQKNEVPATLFLKGSAVAGTPSINAEIDQGHDAGAFRGGRPQLVAPRADRTLSTSAMAAQIGGGTDAFRAATGARTVPLFRPPYGSTNSRVAAVAGSEGFSYLVLWDVDPQGLGRRFGFVHREPRHRPRSQRRDRGHASVGRAHRRRHSPHRLGAPGRRATSS